MNLIQAAIDILLLPLAGFVILIFFGKKLARQGDWLGMGIMFIALALSVFVLVNKLNIPETLEYTFHWVDFGNVPLIGHLQIELGITLDNLSAIMLVVVCLVSSLVHLFSTVYMHGDIRYHR